MSLRARLLNAYLRRFEKPALSRATDEQRLRRQFERQARLTFFAPRGTSRRWESCGQDRVALRLVPPRAREDRVLFYIHGGGFVFGSPTTHAALAATLARRIGATAILPRYRLAPEAAFPAAADDVLAAYLSIARNIDPGRIVLGGDSAGGALVLLLLSRLCAGAGPKPGAVFALSPVTDMTFSGESFQRNAGTEALLPGARSGDMASMYLAGHDGADPACSPLFADFPGSPPVWLAVGDGEILLDDTRRMARHLRNQGNSVEERIAHDLPHVWPIFHNILPEARDTLDDLAGWIRRVQGWPAES